MLLKLFLKTQKLSLDVGEYKWTAICFHSSKAVINDSF